MMHVAPRQDGCHLQAVYPGTKLWRPYVEACAAYVIEEWPDVLDGSSADAFRDAYERDLRNRLAEGGRYLMFCVERGQKVGVANLYTSCLDSSIGESKRVYVTLNVAEFQVSHAHRRQGVGRRFFDSIRPFARDLGCRRIAVEVDCDKEQANVFWSSVLGCAVQSSGRNLFTADVAAVAPSIDFPVAATAHARLATLLCAGACLFLQDDVKVREAQVVRTQAERTV